jgi:hypothetical protein
MAHILAELAGTVGTVTLDPERRRNALSRPWSRSSSPPRAGIA